MTMELTIFLSMLSVAAAIFFGVKSLNRAEKHDTQEETANMTTITVKLENIKEGIDEIKRDMRELRERLTKAEATVTSAHDRLDDHINNHHE